MTFNGSAGIIPGRVQVGRVPNLPLSLVSLLPSRARSSSAAGSPRSNRPISDRPSSAGATETTHVGRLPLANHVPSPRVNGLCPVEVTIAKVEEMPLLAYWNGLGSTVARTRAILEIAEQLLIILRDAHREQDGYTTSSFLVENIRVILDNGRANLRLNTSVCTSMEPGTEVGRVEADLERVSGLLTNLFNLSEIDPQLRASILECFTSSRGETCRFPINYAVSLSDLAVLSQRQPLAIEAETSNGATASQEAITVPAVAPQEDEVLSGLAALQSIEIERVAREAQASQAVPNTAEVTLVGGIDRFAVDRQDEIDRIQAAAGDQWGVNTSPGLPVLPQDNPVLVDGPSFGQPASGPTGAEIVGAGAPTLTNIPAVHLPRVFAGQYTVIETLGSGGFGTVYRCSQKKGPDVVLKVAHNNDISKRMLEAEHTVATQAARISGVAHLASSDIETDTAANGATSLFLVYELVQGHALAENIGAVGVGAGRKYFSHGLGYMAEAARGLASLHEQNIVHGDVCPKNLLVDNDGNATWIDLGASVAYNDRQPNEQAIGKTDYMAPEQVRGETLSPAADIYSLGRSLYHYLVGSNFQAGENFDRGRLLAALRSLNIPDSMHSEVLRLMYDLTGSSRWLPNFISRRVGGFLRLSAEEAAQRINDILSHLRRFPA